MTHDPREALKPCPFCGGNNVILSHKWDYGFIRRYPYCNGCGARGPSFNGEEEARAWWNTRALTASPGEQKPFGWLGRDGKFSLPVEMTRERFLSHFHDNDPPVGTPVIPLYTSAPPAAGWDITDDMVERACKAYADATGYYVEFHRGLSSPSADGMRKGMRAALSALRREAPAPEVVVGKWAVCERCGGSCGCRVPAPSRPDAGGGVREQLAEALAENKALRAANTQLVLAERDRIEAALSTSPAAVESNASVEARLREIIIDLIREKYDPVPSDWLAKDANRWDDGTGEIADAILAALDGGADA